MADNVVRPCPVPHPPEMKKMDPNEYIVAPENFHRLLRNYSALRAYAQGLETTIVCHQTNITKDND